MDISLTPSNGWKVEGNKENPKLASNAQTLDIGQKVNNITGASRSKSGKVTPSKDQTVTNTRDEITGLLTKPNTAEKEKGIERKSRSGRAIKHTKMASHNKDLVAHLTTLPSLNWEDKWLEKEVNAFLTQIDKSDDKEDLLKILTSRLLWENAGNQEEFAFATQLDVEEPET